jgi:hypothetical protein
MNTVTLDQDTGNASEPLTQKLQFQLSNPSSASDFNLHGCLDEVLKQVGLSAQDSGGTVTFYGQDPIVPSRFRFGAMAAVALASRTIALAALWRSRTGDGGHYDRRPQSSAALLRLSGTEMGNDKWTSSGQGCGSR